MTYDRDALWEIVRRASPDGALWLETKISDVVDEPSSIVRPFAGVGRKVGHGIIDASAGPYSWTVDDAARTLLLASIGEAAWNHVKDLYEYGDTSERRGVLRALPSLPSSEIGLEVVNEAIRSNEPVLIIAALGEYALERFSDEELNQAVLKCVFLEISLDTIDGLFERVNPEMSQMLAHLARERVAAGRDVSSDIWPLVSKFPPAAELAAIRSDLQSPIEARAAAAERALQALADAQRQDHGQ